jgi:hypothetical protein
LRVGGAGNEKALGVFEGGGGSSDGGGGGGVGVGGGSGRGGEARERRETEKRLEENAYNVALINYFDPLDAEFDVAHLQQEPYYGMGPMAVSWHRDDGVSKASSIAVYNRCASAREAMDTQMGDTQIEVLRETQRDAPVDDADTEVGTHRGAQGKGGLLGGTKARTHMHTQKGKGGDEVRGDGGGGWKVGVKVSWDVDTPAVAVPMYSGVYRESVCVCVCQC